MNLAGCRTFPFFHEGNPRLNARRAMSLPGKFEVFLFWLVGIVITVLSGAVAIYATHFHLW
jgi:hypothetical protein